MGLMLESRLKDQTRAFGAVEREIIYYRDKKTCAVCGTEVPWSDLEIHHVEEHAKGGLTALENGVVVHRDHHPKGGQAAIDFAKQWRLRTPATPSANPPEVIGEDNMDDSEGAEI